MLNVCRVLLYNIFPIPDHGLGVCDIQRSDRQKWLSAHKLTFRKVCHCLQMLVDGEADGQPRNPTLLGTKVTWCGCTWKSSAALLLLLIRSADQCKVKFKYLIEKYKVVKEEKSKSGQNTKTCHYCEEMETVM